MSFSGGNEPLVRGDKNLAQGSTREGFFLLGGWANFWLGVRGWCYWVLQPDILLFFCSLRKRTLSFSSIAFSRLEDFDFHDFDLKLGFELPFAEFSFFLLAFRLPSTSYVLHVWKRKPKPNQITKPDINYLFSISLFRLFMGINQQFKYFVKLGRFVFNCCSVLMWFYEIINFAGVSGDSGYRFWSCFPKNT